MGQRPRDNECLDHLPHCHQQLLALNPSYMNGQDFHKEITFLQRKQCWQLSYLFTPWDSCTAAQNTTKGIQHEEYGGFFALQKSCQEGKNEQFSTHSSATNSSSFVVNTFSIPYYGMLLEYLHHSNIICYKILLVDCDSTTDTPNPEAIFSVGSFSPRKKNPYFTE